MPTPPSDDLILRYLAGTLDGDTSASVRQYFETTPALRGVHAGLRQLMHADALGEHPDTQGSIANLLRRIDAERAAAEPPVRDDRLRSNQWLARPGLRGTPGSAQPSVRRIGLTLGLTLGVTAAIAVLALVVHPHASGSTHAAANVAGVSPGSHVYRTAAAQTATVTLADGSRVTLAPRTVLVVAKGFGDATRVVSLVGDAYFDVAPKRNIPFVVQTGTVTTRVLGTTFDVRHYAADAQVRVAVTSGKVLAGGHRAPVVLTAGAVARVTDSTGTVTMSDDAAAYTAWTTGRLEFRNTPVAEVLRTVGQWYGIDFQSADPALVAGNVTVVLDHLTRADAIKVLESLLDVSMTFEAASSASAPDTTRIVTLHSRRDASARQRQERRGVFPSLKEVGR